MFRVNKKIRVENNDPYFCPGLISMVRFCDASPPCPSLTGTVTEVLPLKSGGTVHFINPVAGSIDMPEGAVFRDSPLNLSYFYKKSSCTEYLYLFYSIIPLYELRPSKCLSPETI